MPANERSVAAAACAGRLPRFAETQASVLLDLVRGLAALAVLLEHWRNIFFVDFGQVAGHKAWVALPYVLTGAGHQAVVIFFVLSGYLISGSVFRMFERGEWSWERYGVHRLVRLWIVLVPGLALTAVWDRVGMHLTRGPAVAMYAGLSGNHLVQNVHESAGLWVGLGNFVFLQSLQVPDFGSDGALWSLANEFWYYVLFPLGLIALRPGTKGWARVLNGLLFAGVASFLRHGILKEFPIWLLGTLLAVVPPPRLGRGWRWAAAGMYVPMLFGLGRVPHVSGLAVDYGLGVATFLLIWVLLSARDEATPAEGVRTLARFSYTIYVAHTPLLVLLGAMLLGPARWQPDLVHVGLGAGLLVLVVGYCFVLAMGTEFRTDRVRGMVERVLLGTANGLTPMKHR